MTTFAVLFGLTESAPPRWLISRFVRVPAQPGRVVAAATLVFTAVILTG
jgi:hypothetical protein